MVRFIPASELKLTYDVFGHFYSVELASGEEISCRSVLELVEKAHTPADTDRISLQTPNAIFIMMNPGSSEPLAEASNDIHQDSIDNLSISLVPTKPDTTQYQVMRLMHYCGWHHVRVLNLSDLRCTKSTEFFKQFQKLESEHDYDAHSLFSSRRASELADKLTRDMGIPIVRAWGLSPELNPLIERCLENTAGHLSIRGLMKEGSENKYLHPLPSLQSQKIDWVNRMVEQLI